MTHLPNDLANGEVTVDLFGGGTADFFVKELNGKYAVKMDPVTKRYRLSVAAGILDTTNSTEELRVKIYTAFGL